MNADAVVELFLSERRRQVEVEGYAAEHDAYHTNESLARAAATYALPHRYRELNGEELAPETWPWAHRYWKPTPDDRVRELVKAGGLLIAEIERLSAVPVEPAICRCSENRGLSGCVCVPCGCGPRVEPVTKETP